jgi:O-antigen ligase
MLVATLHVSVAARLAMMRVVVAGGIVGGAIGAAQMASGDGAGATLFATAHQAYPVGLFVNRDHQARFLLVVMIAAAVPGVIGRRGRVVAPAIVLLFALGVVATISRMGVLLLPIAIAFAGVLMVGRLPRARVALVGAAVLAAGVAATALGDRTFTRLEVAADDIRFEYRANGWCLAKTLLPRGGGIGSFAGLYGTAEPLGQVGLFYINHAHDDPRQLLIEAGWPGVIMLVMLAALLIAGARRLRVPVDAGAGDGDAAWRVWRLTGRGTMAG